MSVRPVVAALSCVLLAALPATSPAAEISRLVFSQAVAVCQPALPAFDGLIRKRPKAVANEGTAMRS